MKNYQFAADTSDMRLQVEATEILSLFEASLEGMSQVIKKNFCTRPHAYTDVTSICVNAPDQTMLLIDFLSEVLSLSLLHKCVYFRAEFSEFSDVGLTAQIYGTKVNSFDRDVKAVTYHEAEILMNGKGNYHTVIIFDIS